MSTKSQKLAESMNDLPKIHPRHDFVEKARNDLSKFIFGWSKDYTLTTAEILLLLTEYQGSLLQWAVSRERRDPAAT